MDSYVSLEEHKQYSVQITSMQNVSLQGMVQKEKKPPITFIYQSQQGAGEGDQDEDSNAFEIFDNDNSEADM